MVASKECVESASLCALRYGKKLLVAGALLRLGKDTYFHTTKLTVPLFMASDGRTGAKPALFIIVCVVTTETREARTMSACFRAGFASNRDGQFVTDWGGVRDDVGEVRAAISARPRCDWVEPQCIRLHRT